MARRSQKWFVKIFTELDRFLREIDSRSINTIGIWCVRSKENCIKSLSDRLTYEEESIVKDKVNVSFVEKGIFLRGFSFLFFSFLKRTQTVVDKKDFSCFVVVILFKGWYNCFFKLARERTNLCQKARNWVFLFAISTIMGVIGTFLPIYYH